MAMVDEAVRHLRRERDRSFCGNRINGATPGNDQWLHGKVRNVHPCDQTRWLADGAAKLDLQSRVRIVAIAEQCFAGIRDLLYFAVVVFPLAAVQKERDY